MILDANRDRELRAMAEDLHSGACEYLDMSQVTAAEFRILLRYVEILSNTEGDQSHE